MRGGLGLGLALLVAVACGGKHTDDFGDDPEKSGSGGQPGSGGSAVGGGSGSGGSVAAAAGMGGSGGSGVSGSGTGSVCTPGSTQACLGPGQCAGAQRCTAQGDAWADCDCGSSTGGTDGGPAGAGGTEPESGTGGMPAKGGGGSGGGGTGGGSNGGMPAKGGSGGGSNGGGSGEACETDFCDAYCDASTGHCPNDGSREDCMTQCSVTRCTTQEGCLDVGAEYFKCVADSTPVCVADVSVPGDGDCRDEGTAFFDCLVVPWHCDEDADTCICGRTRDSSAPAACEVKHECCLASISGAACGCDDVDLCGDIGPGFIEVDHCPLD